MLYTVWPEANMLLEDRLIDFWVLESIGNGELLGYEGAQVQIVGVRDVGTRWNESEMAP
jgi:hypothetical protein